MNYITCVVLALACLHTAMSENVTEGKCNCGIFSESSSNDPLIVHKLPFNVPCDDEGPDTCHELCIALARGAKERGPALLCEALNKHVENLNVFVQTNACDSDKWKPTGLKLESICCHEGKVTECDTQIPVPSQ